MTQNAKPAVPMLVAEDHECGDCGIAYLRTTIEQAAEIVEELPAAVRRAVAAVPEPAAHRRPAPHVWSVTEYVCHLRDVYVTYTIRLHRTRTEDRPVLEPMLNDLRARRFRYNERDLAPVIDELASVVAGFRDEIGRTAVHDWDRIATRLPGEERTARWLVRQAMHEGVHHLSDIHTVSGSITNVE